MVEHFGVEKAKVIVNAYKDKKDLDKFEKINKKVKKDGKKENEQSTGYCSQEPVNCRWSEYD